MALRIATWNINSIRLRIETVKRFVEQSQIDVLCLQETKAHNDVFPFDALRELGFPHIHAVGMKAYNGTAILSKVPMTPVDARQWCEKDDCRHSIGALPDGTEIHNFYVPAGGDIPDPSLNVKFAHKLRFLDEMESWFAARSHAANRMVLVGDLNIAPLETDVWSHKALLKVVSHTPIEVDRLNKVQASHHWVDAVRHFIPPEQLLYTWWSYRAPDWETADKGRRLDHIWVTPSLQGELQAAEVTRAARGWTLPSDHVPVIVTLK